MTDPAAAAWPARLLVVGSGLIGTSIGLAARAAGADVLVSDQDAAQARLAASMGAGRVVEMGALTPDDPLDLVVVAAPPRAIPPIVSAALRARLGRTVTHVGSVQAAPQRQVEALGVKMERFVGGHPVAGRERTGAAHARPDLFRERAWVVCPGPRTADDAIGDVAALARACGARPVAMTPEAHDLLFARLSHVPQLVSSALAAALLDLAAADVALAGTGLRDSTRLADSDPALWADIVAANADAVAAGLRTVTAPLTDLADALTADPAGGAERVRRLLEHGRSGRRLLPGKHGGAPEQLTLVQVAVPDSPGALADLLAAVAAERVNLEDLRVDHAPGQPLGIAELAVAPTAAPLLVAALGQAGWTVVDPGDGDGVADVGG